MVNHSGSAVRQQERDVRTVIIGAGMSGVLMGIRLMQVGMTNFVILEKGASVGGTWRDNDYPGLHCDVHAHAYCYSFEPNADWSHKFAPGAEIREYFEAVASKYDVMRHIRFNAEVTEARWANNTWHITCADGKNLTADVLISATGILHIPKIPDIEGLSRFQGQWFHSTQWNHSVPLEGKRIGVIGAGSTATQIVTSLAERARKLTMFVRSPQWVARLPENAPYSQRARKLFRRFPSITKLLYRYTLFLWGVFTSGGIMGKNRFIRWLVVRECEKNLATVQDPELRARLTPDFQVGCKRLVLSQDFYDVIQRPDVDYVTDPIDHVEPRGVVTKDGTLHKLDMLALATGFDSSAFLGPMRIVGENGHTVQELWADGPISYRTVALPYMPNFFMLQGPFSPAGNLPFTAVSEWQSDYIMKCIDYIRNGMVAGLYPSMDATEKLMKRYREEARGTIWGAGGCTSWYLGKDGVPIIYPFSAYQYRREMTADPDFNDFKLIDPELEGNTAQNPFEQQRTAP